MVSITVNVGKNLLPKLKGEMRERAGRALDVAALNIEGGAKRRAPVDTGRLRRSIETRKEGDLTRIVQVGAEYGVHVELGTRHRAASPFLTPAVEEEKPKLQARLREVLTP
jgi:HK97 gp10 family phage protein